MKPIVVMSCGDPLGIGPEIVAQTLADGELRKTCIPVAVGDRRILCRAAALYGIPDFERRFQRQIVDVPCRMPPGSASGIASGIASGSDPARAPEGSATPEVPTEADTDRILAYAGTVQAFAGQAAYDCICRAHALCQSGLAQAVATAPINKEALRRAGIPHIGHTEIFAALTNTGDPLTMFETCGLRIFFLTRHMALREACDAITYPRLLDYIARCTRALKNIGVVPSREAPLAVAALNPHGGEHGLFGTEEIHTIAPAVRDAQQKGLYVEGPIGADSVFHQAKAGRYCAVLSLYHDQGHIAAKTLDFERTISVTHGLPYLRTSVDHGTAFDIAWKGTAGAVSMREAVRLAAFYRVVGNSAAI